MLSGNVLNRYRYDEGGNSKSMNSYQIVGLIMVIFGIILLVFCRRIANLIRLFWSYMGINLSEWKGIAGLCTVGIVLMNTGFCLVALYALYLPSWRCLNNRGNRVVCLDGILSMISAK